MPKKKQPSVVKEILSAPALENAVQTVPAETNAAGWDDSREALFDSQAVGPAYEIARPVEQVACIRGFMIDLDLNILNPDVLGAKALTSSQAFYDQHVKVWLDRDPVLTKGEVRDTGHGLHILLWLGQPIICSGDDNRHWDNIARGIRNALPGDPKVNGINAMTRPVGTTNNKESPAAPVRCLREGQPVTREEILDLNRRVSEEPAPLWMRLFNGADRVTPCPVCKREGSSLGVAGKWQCRCYKCGQVHASVLIFRVFRYFSGRAGVV